MSQSVKFQLGYILECNGVSVRLSNDDFKNDGEKVWICKDVLDKFAEKFNRSNEILEKDNTQNTVAEKFNRSNEILEKDNTQNTVDEKFNRSNEILEKDNTQNTVDKTDNLLQKLYNEYDQIKINQIKLKNELYEWKDKCKHITDFDITLFDVKDEILEHFAVCEETFEMLKQKCIDCIKNKIPLNVEIVGNIDKRTCDMNSRACVFSGMGRKSDDHAGQLFADYFQNPTIYEWFLNNQSKANAINLIKHILSTKYDVNMYLRNNTFNIVSLLGTNYYNDQIVVQGNNINNSNNRFNFYNNLGYSHIMVVKCDFNLNNTTHLPNTPCGTTQVIGDVSDPDLKIKYDTICAKISRTERRCNKISQKIKILQEKYETYLKASLNNYSYLDLPNYMLEANYICVTTFNKLKKKVIKAIESNQNIKIEIDCKSENYHKNVKLNTMYYFRSLVILKSNHMPKIVNIGNSGICAIEFNFKQKKKQ